MAEPRNHHFERRSQQQQVRAPYKREHSENHNNSPLSPSFHQIIDPRDEESRQGRTAWR